MSEPIDFFYSKTLTAAAVSTAADPSSGYVVNQSPAFAIDSGSIQLIAPSSSLTVVFEWSLDAVPSAGTGTWWPLTVFPNGGGAGITSVVLAAATLSAVYLWNLPGARFVRARISAFTSGSVAASVLGGVGHIDTSVAAGGATLVNVGLTTATDRSGTVTLGGTAQNAMAANAARQGGYIFNPYNATESLFVSESGTATTASPELKPGAIWDIRSTNAISVLGATTTHAWAGEER